jgi:hypothetical protein
MSQTPLESYFLYVSLDGTRLPIQQGKRANMILRLGQNVVTLVYRSRHTQRSTHLYDKVNSYGAQHGGQSICHSTICFEYRKLGRKPNTWSTSLSNAENVLWGPSTQQIYIAKLQLVYKLLIFSCPTCHKDYKTSYLQCHIAKQNNQYHQHNHTIQIKEVKGIQE